MKKIFALAIALSFGLGSIGCDDKPKPSTVKSTVTSTGTSAAK